MRRFFCAAALAALVIGSAGPAPADADASPSDAVHVFHYTWYRNPATDGSWAHWDHPVMLRGGGGQRG